MQKENNSILDLSDLSENQLLEIFSYDNVFIEANQNNASVSSDNVAKELATVTPESEVPAAFEPAVTEVRRQPLSAMTNTIMYSASEFQLASLINSHFVINPNITYSTADFHFHGQP